MTKFVVIKQDSTFGIKHYEKSDGRFSKNIQEAAKFSKKTAEKHVEDITRSLNAFMKARIRITAEETDVEELTTVA